MHYKHNSMDSQSEIDFHEPPDCFFIYNIKLIMMNHNN